MGIEAPLESVPAEAIGGLRIGVTPLEMADAYATLANGGIHHDPTAVSRVEFPNGKVDEPGTDGGDRVLTEGEAYDVTELLKGVITQGTGAGYTSIGCESEAGKTGTSEGESDAWFVGYTPMFSTAVWVGHPQSRERDRLRRPHRRPDLAVLHVLRPGRRVPRIQRPRKPARTLRPRQHPHPSSGYSGEDEEESYEGEEEESEEADKRRRKGSPGRRRRRQRTGAPKPPPRPAPRRHRLARIGPG